MSWCYPIFSVVLFFLSFSNGQINLCRNRIVNPSADNGLTGWTIDEGGERTGTYEGNSVFILDNLSQRISQTVNIPAGATTLWVGGWVKSSDPWPTGGQPYFYAQVRNGGGSITRNFQYGNLGRDIWQFRGSNNYALLPGDATVTVYLDTLHNDWRGSLSYFDHIQVFFGCPRWLPAPGDFTPPCENNLVQNPNADDGLDDWVIFRGTPVPSTEKYTGNNVFQFDELNTGLNQNITIPTASRTAWLSGWFRHALPGDTIRQLRFFVWWLAPDGTRARGESVLSPPITAKWTQLTMEFTHDFTSAGFASAEVGILLSDSSKDNDDPSDQVGYFDDIRLAFNCVPIPSPKPAPIRPSDLPGECVAHENCTDPYFPGCRPRSASFGYSKCVECRENEHCKDNPEGKNICHRDRCVQCKTSAQCTGSNGRCEGSTGTCLECLNNNHCDGGFCDKGSGTCVECWQHSHCKDEVLDACDLCNGTCVDCVRDKQCPDGLHCGHDHQCVCSSHRDCRYQEGLPACLNGNCVPCAIRADCTDPMFPYCRPGIGQCVNCRSNNHCATGEACVNYFCRPVA